MPPQINSTVLTRRGSFQLPNGLFRLPEPCSCVLVLLSNLRTLQKSSPSTSAGGEQWQERPLCLGSASTCGSMLMGNILGFGEDEIGELRVFPFVKLSSFCHCCACVSSQKHGKNVLYASFKRVQTKMQK